MAIADNVELKADVRPKTLASAMGALTFWLNNNNDWTADVGTVLVTIRALHDADIALVVAGTMVESQTSRVGDVGSWSSSRPIAIQVCPKPSATAASETVDVTCTVGRLALSPNQLPQRRSPLREIVLVNL